jgi:hypothetical protein
LVDDDLTDAQKNDFAKLTLDHQAALAKLEAEIVKTKVEYIKKRLALLSAEQRMKLRELTNDPAAKQ